MKKAALYIGTITAAFLATLVAAHAGFTTSKESQLGGGSFAGGAVTDPVELPDGSNTAPALSNDGDENTGLYFGAADQINFATGGTSRFDLTTTALNLDVSLVGDTGVISWRSNTTPQFDVGTVGNSILRVDSSGSPHVRIGAAAYKLGWASGTTIEQPSDGRLLITNAAGTAGTELSFVTDGAFFVRERTKFRGITLHNEATQTLTFAGGGGDASKTASALCPADVFVLGITGRWTTSATTCTSADIGDGSDVDMYADNLAVTAGTTFNLSQNTATSRLGVFQGSASDVVVTGVGGNCVSGVIRVTCHYIDLTADVVN